LAAQQPHAIMVARVEDPHAPRRIPYPAETAGSGRETGVVRAADRDAAVLLDDRQRHSNAPLSDNGLINLAPGSSIWRHLMQSILQFFRQTIGSPAALRLDLLQTRRR